MALPSVGDLCFCKLTEPSRLVDTWNRVDPTAVNDFAVALLRDRGFVLVGHPTVVNGMKAVAKADVEAAFDAIDALANRRRSRVGRPRASHERDVIAAAAFFKFKRKGLGPVAARREAAKFIGSTVGHIEKATPRFVKQTLLLGKFLKAEEPLRLVTHYLYHVGAMLDECAAERREMTMRPRQKSA